MAPSSSKCANEAPHHPHLSVHVFFLMVCIHTCVCVCVCVCAFYGKSNSCNNSLLPFLKILPTSFLNCFDVVLIYIYLGFLVFFSVVTADGGIAAAVGFVVVVLVLGGWVFFGGRGIPFFALTLFFLFFILLIVFASFFLFWYFVFVMQSIIIHTFVPKKGEGVEYCILKNKKEICKGGSCFISIVKIFRVSNRKIWIPTL